MRGRHSVACAKFLAGIASPKWVSTSCRPHVAAGEGKVSHAACHLRASSDHEMAKTPILGLIHQLSIALAHNTDEPDSASMGRVFPF
jgi:hypothetical protein